MIDRRDFDEWWARELARNPMASTTWAEHDWAYRAFMAAGQLMSQAARTQKHIAAKQAQRPAALLMRDMLKAADK